MSPLLSMGVLSVGDMRQTEDEDPGSGPTKCSPHQGNIMESLTRPPRCLGRIVISHPLRDVVRLQVPMKVKRQTHIKSVSPRFFICQEQRHLLSCRQGSRLVRTRTGLPCRSFLHLGGSVVRLPYIHRPIVLNASLCGSTIRKHIIRPRHAGFRHNRRALLLSMKNG